MEQDVGQSGQEKSVNILIVDDDRLSRNLASRALETAGYQAKLADGARQAREILNQGEPVILILSDLTMPETDGLTFLAEIRSNPAFADLPVLIHTSIDPKRWTQAAETLGFAGHVKKPLNAQELIERVSATLESTVAPVEDSTKTMRRLQISAADYFDALRGLAQDIANSHGLVESSSTSTDFETLGSTFDGLSGAARSLGALRLAPLLKSASDICPSHDIAQIRQIAPQLLRELRILQAAIDVVEREQAKQAKNSKAGSYVLPMARGAIWKRHASQ
jgi:two-component system, chemotaxis family, chemotaxis protein CheY